jgi:RNA polymerase sigma factor (sigma-70 family)
MDRRDPATGRGPRVVAGGSYADWEAIYEDNVTRVYRMLLAGVGNRADAEDLTAEVFLAALRPLRLSATVPQVRAYLRVVARTALAAHRRATSGVEVTSIEEIGDLVYDSEDAIGTAPQRVKVLLEALPKHYRRILELRFLDGRSVKDCAEELGVSVANAKVLQHRALRLAARLHEKHP